MHGGLLIKQRINYDMYPYVLPDNDKLKNVLPIEPISNLKEWLMNLHRPAICNIGETIEMLLIAQSVRTRLDFMKLNSTIVTNPTNHQIF